MSSAYVAVYVAASVAAYVAALQSNKLLLNEIISRHRRERPVTGHPVINPGI
jgi:hypothetical protein